MRHTPFLVGAAVVALVATAGCNAPQSMVGGNIDSSLRVMMLGTAMGPYGYRNVQVVPRGGDFVVMVDASQDGRYQDVAEDSVTFSADGQHVAYAAASGVCQAEAQEGAEAVEYGGLREQRRADRSGRAERGEKWFVVQDGAAGPEYDGIRLCSIRLSSDGGRLAYAARTGDQWHVVVDGVEGPAFAMVSPPAFSRDDSRLAYAATRVPAAAGSRPADERAVVVVDGKTTREYESIAPTSVLFSPDGSHLAYAARLDGKWHVVLDGKLGAAYDGVDAGNIRFSLDGRHLAFAASQGADRFIVMDGRRERSFEGIAPRSLSFSFDSRFCCYVAQRGGKDIQVTEDVRASGGAAS